MERNRQVIENLGNGLSKETIYNDVTGSSKITYYRECGKNTYHYHNFFI